MKKDENGKDIFTRIIDKIFKKIEKGILNAIENAEIVPKQMENGESEFSLSIQMGTQKQEIGTFHVVHEEEPSPSLILIPSDFEDSREERQEESLKADDKKSLPVIRMTLSEAIQLEAEREKFEQQSKLAAMEQSMDLEDSRNEEFVQDEKNRSQKDRQGIEKEASQLGMTCEFEMDAHTLKKYIGTRAEVEIPEGVEKIASQAFAKTHIQSVRLPESLVEIGDHAFGECEHLKAIFWNQNIQRIGQGAFENNRALAVISFPETIVSLGAEALKGCLKLKKVVLPRSLTKISEGLFENCPSLETIRWPNSPEVVGKNIFKGCLRGDHWEIMELDGDEIKRRRVVSETLDPDGLCDFSCSFYAQHQMNHLLNDICSEISFRRDETLSLLAKYLDSLKISNVISSNHPYCRLQVTRVFQRDLETLRKLEMHEILWNILSQLGGTGRSFRLFDREIRRDIFGKKEDDGVFDSEDDQIAVVMEKLWLTVMTELHVALTPNRYHPSIVHYSAVLPNDVDYWTFVETLEGMLRYDKIAIPEDIELGDTDLLEDWMRRWSLGIADSGKGILRISGERMGKNAFILMVMTEEKARSVYAILKAHGCHTDVSYWMRGENVFGLTLIE